MKKRNPTRAVRIGKIIIGGGRPIAVQSMCSTHTSDVAATVAQVRILEAAGADVVRLAVDGPADAEALQAIRAQTSANLCADLQENYRMVSKIAPHVDKIRYNPGHLHHLDPHKSIREKVASIADCAAEHGCAMRIGVNCGSVDPALAERYGTGGVEAMVASATKHCSILDAVGFDQYCVSLKDSDPARVIEANRRFAAERPDVPLHLGVTEAGLPPEGVIKTRIAFEQLIRAGIGDTIRVSLTVPGDRKGEEIVEGRRIVEEIEQGRFRSVPADFGKGLKIISCPSCSRVENEAFVDLARKVHEAARFAADRDVTIAVMGCRVNGPGETDAADIGLWCAPGYVNLKLGSKTIGRYPYDEIVSRLVDELRAMPDT